MKENEINTPWKALKVRYARRGIDIDSLTTQSTAERMATTNPTRTPWGDFPDAVIYAPESTVKKHLQYPDAKAGHIPSAQKLVQDLVTDKYLEKLRDDIADQAPIVTAVHAAEDHSTNVIPAVMADHIAFALGLQADLDIMQINRVSHTGASGYHRLATPPLFAGDVCRGANYLLVDDFIGQGGTLANLRGHIEDNGGNVIGIVVLTGKPYSAKLQLTQDTLDRLRAKHGQQLENWWQEQFGFGLDQLTESEARYLERSDSFDKIRNQITQAKQAAGA